MKKSALRISFFVAFLFAVAAAGFAQGQFPFGDTKFSLPMKLGTVAILEGIQPEGDNIKVQVTLLRHQEYLGLIRENPGVVKEFIEQHMDKVREKLDRYLDMLPKTVDFGVKIEMKGADSQETAVVEFSPKDLQELIAKIRNFRQ